MQGNKFDSDKPDWSLLNLDLIEPIVKVLTFGSKKYSRGNWRHVPDATNRYYAAMMRHLEAWQRGERFDSETGESHLAHAGCCLVFLLWFDRL